MRRLLIAMVGAIACSCMADTYYLNYDGTDVQGGNYRFAWTTNGNMATLNSTQTFSGDNTFSTPVSGTAATNTAYFVTLGQMDASIYSNIEARAEHEFWLSTNIHATLGGSNMVETTTHASVTLTQSLSTGTNDVGVWWTTNDVATAIPSGIWTLHADCSIAVVGTADAMLRFILLGSTTNTLSTSDDYTIPTTDRYISPHATLTTNVTDTYFGIKAQAVKTGAGTATLTFRVGLNETHLETPGGFTPADVPPHASSHNPGGGDSLNYAVVATNAASGTSLLAMSNNTWVVITPGGGTDSPPYSYISGCWPTYTDTNTVTIGGTNGGGGDGWCYDTYFSITNPAGISVDVSTWATTNWNGSAGWGCQYFYCDYDGSTFPNAPVIYSATNLPTKDTVYNQFVNSAVPQDRLLAAVIQTNQTTELLPFHVDQGFYFHNYFDVSLGVGSGLVAGSNMNPDGTWQTPDDAETSLFLPVGASVALVVTRATEDTSGQQCYCAVATYEYTTAISGGNIVQQAFQSTVIYGWALPVFYIPLGPSRNLRIAGQDDDGNTMCLLVKGYELSR